MDESTGKDANSTPADPGAESELPNGDVHKLWLAAVEAAGLDVEDVEVELVAANPEGEHWGFALAPGDSSAGLGPEHGLTEDVLHAIDALDPDKHRVVVFLGSPRLPNYVILALMRHELRHVEQSADNDCYRIGMLAVRALEHELGGTGPGGRSLGRDVPHEQDADSAAVALVGEHSDALDILDGNFRGLLTQPRSLESIASLRPRVVAFFALYADGFKAAANEMGWTTEWVLNHFSPEAHDIYARVAADEEVNRLRVTVSEAIPTTEMIEAAGTRPADAWAQAHARLVEAQRHAERMVLEAWPA